MKCKVDKLTIWPESGSINSDLDSARGPCPANRHMDYENTYTTDMGGRKVFSMSPIIAHDRHMCLFCLYGL